MSISILCDASHFLILSKSASGNNGNLNDHSPPVGLRDHLHPSVSVRPSSIKILSTNALPDIVHHTTQTIASAFKNDPIFHYSLNRHSRTTRLGFRGVYYETLIRAARLNDGMLLGIVDTAGIGLSTAAVVLPPGMTMESWRTIVPAGLCRLIREVGLVSVLVSVVSYSEKSMQFFLFFELINFFKRMILNMPKEIANVRARALGGPQRVYFYLLALGTTESARGKGQGTAMVKHIQAIAAQENLPIWLEATTYQSRDFYLTLGFVNEGEIVVGRGKVDHAGNKEKGGEGVTMWGMSWTPSPEDMLF